MSISYTYTYIYIYLYLYLYLYVIDYNRNFKFWGAKFWPTAHIVLEGWIAPVDQVNHIHVSAETHAAWPVVSQGLGVG